jgi:hypothetical protein
MNSKLVLTHLKHKGTFQKTVRTIGRMCKYEKEFFSFYDQIRIADVYSEQQKPQ